MLLSLSHFIAFRRHYSQFGRKEFVLLSIRQRIHQVTPFSQNDLSAKKKIAKMKMGNNDSKYSPHKMRKQKDHDSMFLSNELSISDSTASITPTFSPSIVVSRLSYSGRYPRTMLSPPVDVDTACIMKW